MTAELAEKDRSEIQVCAFQLTNKFYRAVGRCRDMAQSESLLGYTESASAYRATADEIAAARQWMNGYFNDLLYS
jgi:hypothetical protein